MFLVQAFKAHQREPVTIRLVNVDMTPEERFSELCLDGVTYYCLHYNKKILIPRIKRRSPENGVVYCAINTTGLAHTNFIVMSRILI